MSAHRAPGATRRRRVPVVGLVATVLGVWFGLSAPDTSPVTPPAPVVQQQPAVGGGR